MTRWSFGAAILAIAASAPCAAAQTADGPSGRAVAEDASAVKGDAGDDIIVTGHKVAFAVAEVTPAMIERQSALTSVNDLINELPGVSVQEGDAFGSSDWATSISIRGFNSGGGSDSQQIGTTIDGLPNGGSGYGGGSRANRYVDVLDIATVRVSQGTADISSRSNEALGGTLDYVTADPLGEARLRVLAAGGDYGARKIYARADTGTFAPDTRAYLSAASSYVRDWIGGAGETRRQHLTAKLLSRVAAVDLTGFASYDQSDEAEFGSVAPEQFAIDPDHDAYTDHWTGLPYVDQAYRAAQRGARRNLFGYLKARAELGPVKLMLAGYYHRMRGQGDFAPPFIVDTRDDGLGRPESELGGGAPAIGSSPLGKIYFVTPSGAAATPIEPCSPLADVPALSSPSCYPAGSTAVMSYRHTHYRHGRAGTLVDADWEEQIGGAENHLRAGFWFEHDRANHVRDFHRVLNALIGPAYDHHPYYVQFSTDYALDEVMYYAEDALSLGPITARAGIKQFFLDQRRDSLLGKVGSNPLSSRSRPLLNAGATYAGPLAGLELFAGYSQNFAAIPQGVLDKPAAAVRNLHPETADNIELGARYGLGPVKASLTGYDIRFKNQIVAITSNLVTGIDYLSEQSSVYRNVGGVRSRGVEAALAYRVLPPLTLSGTYTYNHATYIGTGNAAQDENVGVTPGKQVINSPRRMWTLAADYRAAVVQAGLAAKFVGDRNIDTQAKAVARGFTLLSGYVGADLEGVSEQLKGVSFKLQGTNLADVRYLAGADGGSAFLGTARTVTAALSLDF